MTEEQKRAEEVERVGLETFKDLENTKRLLQKWKTRWRGFMRDLYAFKEMAKKDKLSRDLKLPEQVDIYIGLAKQRARQMPMEEDLPDFAQHRWDELKKSLERKLDRARKDSAWSEPAYANALEDVMEEMERMEEE